MRVTQETRAATRARILQAAGRLFAGSGFDAATTRQIADAAGIAAGTLFNYFASKEQVLACLAAEALESARRDFESSGQGAEGLEEALFAFVIAGLRKLKPLRRHLPALLDTGLNPLLNSDEQGQAIRTSHLEAVARLATTHRAGELSPVALQLYWTLYIGLLMFWSADRSPKQEDTLALLDESLSMFVGWLAQPPDAPADK